ncbi:MAG: hypothetical protein DRZ79_01040 [Candidatus Cloacimonadota bacterium]|nr:MAG: hypothetical protein DRZ79_01040 [Candidatus Cloacimonadota bacterium]
MSTRIDKEDKILGFIIFGFWGLLICFGIISLINPRWLSKISEPGRISESNDYKNMGDIAMRGKKYSEAIPNYLMALKVNPESYSALGNLGIAYSKMGKEDKAIATFEYLIKKIPEQKNVAYINLAMLFEKKNNFEKALYYYKLASEIDPFPIFAFNRLGVLYLKTQNWEKAAEAFQNSIKDETNMEYIYKGMLKKELQNTKDSDKIKLLSSYLEKENIKKDLKKYDKSVFTEYTQHNKNLAKSYRNLAYAYKQLGNYEEAAKNLKKALRIWPSFSKARKELKALETTDIFD